MTANFVKLNLPGTEPTAIGDRCRVTDGWWAKTSGMEGHVGTVVRINALSCVLRFEGMETPRSICVMNYRLEECDE